MSGLDKHLHLFLSYIITIEEEFPWLAGWREHLDMGINTAAVLCTVTVSIYTPHND